YLHVVLDAMIELVEQQTLLGLGLPSLADIHQHVDGADNLSRCIAQRRRKGNERDARPIGPFGDSLRIAYRPSLLQRDGHRTLVMWQRRAVRIVEFPGNAPFIAAQRRRATRKLDGRFVEISNLAL